MTRKKILYYYDEENCSYQKAGFSWGSFARKAGVFAGIAVAVVVLMVFVFPDNIESFKIERLEAKQASLQEQMAELNNELDGKEREMKVFLSRSNSIYLPIIGEKNISRSEWEGGMGGSPLQLRHINTPNYRLSQRIQKLNFQVQLLKNKFETVNDKAKASRDILDNLPSIQPVTGIMISGFGNRTHPVTGHTKFHEGLDFSCSIGTPVYATGNGVVFKAEYNANGYGNCINLDHGNGYNTKYAHLSKMLVKDGQRVNRGDLIGYSGNTGMSTGPHLHYEVMRNGVKVDPLDFFYENLSPERYRTLVHGASGGNSEDESMDKIYSTAPMD